MIFSCLCLLKIFFLISFFFSFFLRCAHIKRFLAQKFNTTWQYLLKQQNYLFSYATFSFISCIYITIWRVIIRNSMISITCLFLVANSEKDKTGCSILVLLIHIYLQMSSLSLSHSLSVFLFLSVSPFPHFFFFLCFFHAQALCLSGHLSLSLSLSFSLYVYINTHTYKYICVSLNE